MHLLLIIEPLRDLFNVAFVSCWSELHEELQNELVKHLEMALGSQIPEITQTLLNLAEFMEHTEKVPDIYLISHSALLLYGSCYLPLPIFLPRGFIYVFAMSFF